MKFKCGPTHKEIIAKIEIMENWHDHFAWWPVSVARGDCRWLETVERRYYQWRSDRGGYMPSYRDKQKELNK